MHVARLALPIVGLMCAACETPPKTDGALADPALAAAADALVGTYSSAEQARSDPEFPNIQLTIVPMWTTRGDGPWLYAENAEAGAPSRPYRQRVHQLALTSDPALSEGTIELRVFELPGDPLAFAGDPKRLDALTPELLLARPGCTIFIAPGAPGTWSGATDADACASTLRGATTSTIDISFDADELRWWERGFDANGKQVWGPAKGPIQYLRTK